MKDLSLLVAYRDRPAQIEALVEWYQECQNLTKGNLELIVVESSEESTEWLRKLDLVNMKYLHLKEDGPFNKSRILNAGLELSESKYVTPFDVDLVPYNLSFSLHLALANQSDIMLVTGFRVDTDLESFRPDQLSLLQSRASIAKEDLHEGFMFDQLINKHRFGVLPFFKRTRLEEINGWDEAYVGWGCEDQDIIHRYLGEERYLIKSPDLVYLHLKHPHTPDWNDGDMTRKNRKILFEKFDLKPNVE
ncbi:glycosyltransferase family 2 protein [Fulvivirga sp. 29W222]|uniref:Glycosyltransferase family 2 protein n=1 Tax=Fulvivirga marina TaxID=2494733 RepID=A0A937G352_9BACT|nr:glycosyltransferase family 2 protein [Fulvivirga marina]MBL6447566.1 glycosyltransferase family 2 protein [Fulvivirga marina]